MRLPRMMTRRWIIAVAIVAFLFGMANRSRRFSAIADLYYGHSEASVNTQDERRRIALWNAHNRARCRKYRRAARYPWLRGKPDPAPPEGVSPYRLNPMKVQAPARAVKRDS